MQRRRPKILFIPVFGLLLAVLLLLVIVAVSTLVTMKHGKKLARHVLQAQSESIVGGLAAGLQTGWRYWIWRADSLQGLVEQLTKRGDVEYIALLGKNGRVLAHSNPNLVGKQFGQVQKLAQQLKNKPDQGWFNGKELYIYGRIMREEDYGRPPPISGRGVNEPGPGRRQLAELRTRLRPHVIVVGLKTKTYREIIKRQFSHALILGFFLFILGSAAIYFIFLVQNYRTIDRTLSDYSSYTSGIVDNMPGGLITLNAADEPVVVNRAARDMFGWGDRPEQELRRETVIRDLANEYRNRLTSGEVILEEELEACLGSGENIPLAVSASLVPTGVTGEKEPGTVFILRDLSQIRDLESQVREKEKLAAVGRLAAGVAHEVRNPLSSMRGLAKFLARGMDKDSRETEYLKVMVDEIDRLSRVINGLLDYAKPKQPTLSPTDLNQAARHTLELIRDDAHHHGVTIVEELSDPSPSIMADKDQLIQAMLNLCLNAIEAMENGGRLSVCTRRENKRGLFIVEDTGPGISPEDRTRLFDPFYTTKKKGTGLGLAQVAGIVKAHDGVIKVGGTFGKGARFTMSFQDISV